MNYYNEEGIEDIELNLLMKTEIWINNIKLSNVNLKEIAKAVAEVLNLREDEVLVTDVRDNILVLDILRRTITAKQIIGKKDEILRKLSTIPGVTITPETSIHSEGILGLIAVDKDIAKGVLERTAKLVKTMKQRISKRVIVYSTGFELKKGLIKDTNVPLIKEFLGKYGYDVKIGGILEDDEHEIANAICKALDEGYGMIILTGGVGAEDKDRTIEGLIKVDPKASTPYVVKYKKGEGRHVKEGVRIGVGKVGPTFIIALPGPTDEVKICLEALIDGLKRNLDKEALANLIANKLRENLINKMKHHLHHH